MKKSWLWIAVPAGLALGLLLLLNGSGTEPISSAPRRASSASRSAYLSSAGREVSLRSSPGERRRYSMRSRYHIQVDLGIGKSEFTLETEGELHERIYEPGLHGLRFRPLHVNTFGPRGEAVGDYEGMRGELETETLVRREESGRARSIRFSEEIGSEARNFLRGLLGAVEVIVPPENSGRWVARGEDTTGRFMAEYSLTHSSEEGVRLTRRRRYEELFLQGSLGEARAFDLENGGETKISLDSAGRLESVEGEETLSVKGRAGENCVVVRSESHIRVVLLEAGPDDDTLRASESARRQESERTAVEGFVPEAVAFQRASVRDRTLHELVGDLTRAAERGSWAQEAPGVFLNLKELLGDSEEARITARDLLRSGALAPDVVQTVADALASTPTGWKDLLSLVEEPALEPGRRLAAVQALGVTPHPSIEVVQALARWARSSPDPELASSAVDSMGLAAGLPTNRAERDAIASELSGLQGRSAEQDARVIRALGNAASPETLGAIVGRADAADPELRASVATALRKFPTKEAWDVGVRLTSDSSPEVRACAVAALSRRSEPEVPKVLESIVRGDPDPMVRREALEFFAERHSTPVLAWARENDPSEELRTYAAAQLKKF